MLRNMEKPSTFKLITSRSSICLVYYDQQCKRMQILLCQDGYLEYEGELLVDNRKKLDEYESYLETQRRKLRTEEKKDLAEAVTRALAAVDQIKRCMDARKKSQACSIELDTLSGGHFAIDFLDQNSQSLKKMGPFPHKNGFAHLTVSVENNWKKIGSFIIRKKGSTQIFGPFELTDNLDPSVLKKYPIRSCRAAGQVAPKHLGSLQTSSCERHARNRDNRTVVKNLLAKESDACVAKLVLEFETVDYDTKEPKRRFYQGTASLINMRLEDGNITKCFLTTAGHNFLQVDTLEGTKHWLVGCTAFLRCKGERDFSKKIPVKRYKVYDRYLDLKQKDMGYQGVDFAIAAVDVNPNEVEVRTFDSRFTTLPTNYSDLNLDKSSIDIRVTGYSDLEKNRFQPLTMDGKVNRVIKKKGGHALLVYDNVDTSAGTDGAMILWKQAPGVGRFLGVHVGRSEGRSYGLLLTQSVMSWMYDTVTSGQFWEGSYVSPIQQPIGCRESYDPYRDSNNSLYVQQEEEEIEAADAGAWRNLGYY